MAAETKVDCITLVKEPTLYPRKVPGRMVLAMAVAVLAGLNSCATTASKVAPNSGEAILDAIPSKKHRDRVHGARIVSVNGQSSGRESVSLPPGSNQMKVRYNWPRGRKQEVSLTFNARKNQRYYVSYVPYPPSRIHTSSTYKGSDAAKQILDLGKSDSSGYIRAALMFPAIGAAFAEPVYRTITQNIPARLGAAHYVDVRVVSEDPTEGVVRSVRAYPDGKVDTEPRDGWSIDPDATIFAAE